MFVYNRRKYALTVTLLVIVFIVSGCGLIGGSAEPTPEEPTTRALVPTFTPTPEGMGETEDVSQEQAIPAQPAAQESQPEQAVAEMPAVDESAVIPPAAEAEEPPADEPPAEEPTPQPVEEAPTPTPVAKVIIDIPTANVRGGPGTNYGVVGSATSGQTFDIIAKNTAGDWWQFCCVNGQEGWIFGEIVRTENADNVPVASSIPEPPAPVAQAPPPQPEPTTPPQEEAPPPPSSDPCAGIGGDGCKFRHTGGPLFASNGGNEIKMQLLFKHSGVEGGQPQGSYFVVLEKDGVKLPVSDSVRSIALNASDGALGRFNYEYKIGTGDIPGNTVAGNYTMYVLDGNGERDSQNLNFSIPEGQGELWVEWDQG